MPNLVKSKSWMSGCDFAQTTTGGPDVCQTATVNGSTAVHRGDILTIGSGVVTAIAASPTAVYGVAMHDAAVNSSVLVALAVPENVFLIRVKAATALSTAVPGLQCDIVGTGGAMTLDTGTTTNKVAEVIGRMGGDDTADTTTPGRAFIRFIRSQAGNGAAS
jgi:hypothetical protein